MRAERPGEVLQFYMKRMGLSQTGLADLIGCRQAKVSDVVHGRRRISTDFALDLEKVTKVRADMWINLQTRHDLSVARRKRTRAKVT